MNLLTRTAYAGLLSSLLIAAGAASADIYNFEVGAAYGEVSADSISDDGDFIAAHATAYFNPVEREGGPLRYAPFLNRASSITFGYESAEIDGSDLDIRFQSLSSRMVNKETGWLGELFFGHSRVDLPQDGEPKVSENTLGIGVGKYIAMNATVTGFYSTTEETNVDTYGAEYHQVFVGDPTSLGIRLRVENVDNDGQSDTNWGWEGSLAFNNNVSVAVQYGYDGASEDDVWGVEASWFVIDCLELAASIAKQSAGNESIDIGVIRTTFTF